MAVAQRDLPVGTAQVVADAPGKRHALTFSLDTSAYASGDVVATTQELTGVFDEVGGTALLKGFTLVDQDDQKVALHIVFMSANNDLGAENGAPDLTDAEALDVLGVVSIAAADYVDLGGVAVVTKTDINLPLHAAAASTSLFVAILNQTGTPTYTAAGLKANFHIA